MVLGGPARQIDENLAILKRPRADRHHSEKPAFCCRGEAPQLAKGDFTGVRTSRLAPPPVRQEFR